MASSYVLRGNRCIPTYLFRCDTLRMDVDIAHDPEVLSERLAYEERRHSGQSREVIFELEMETVVTW